MAYQGQLDGLCGPYAIVNAYDLCKIDRDSWEFDDIEWLYEDILEHIFRTSCMAINGRYWPRVLWKGTTFGQMRRMLEACQKFLEREYNKAGRDYPIKVTYPFYKASNTPPSDKEYWKRFNKIFSDDSDAICGIIGMDEPSTHWFAFSKTKKTLDVYDSTHYSEKGAMKQLRLKNIHAGTYQKDRYVIARRELIVFTNNA